MNSKRKRVLKWTLLAVVGLAAVIIMVAFMSSDRAGKISIGFVGYVDGTNGVKYAKFIGTNFNTRPIHYEMRDQRLFGDAWVNFNTSVAWDWGPAQAREDIVWLAPIPAEGGSWRIVVRFDTYLGRVDRGRMWLADFLNQRKFTKTARLVWTHRQTSVAFGPEMRK